MRKLPILMGIFAISIILVIPAGTSFSPHLAKASTCSSHASKPGGASNAGPITGTGSCSASAAVGSGPLSLSAATSLSHKSGCTTASAGPNNFRNSQSQDSNIGGVNCASQSP